MKKIILIFLLPYCVNTSAQEILGEWIFNNAEIIIKTNKESYTQAITQHLEKEISDYYKNTSMEFLNNGLYNFDGEKAGRFEVEGNKFIDIKTHKDRIDTVIIDITSNTLTFHMDPAKLGFFTPKRLKALNIADPESIQIEEAEMLIHWTKLPPTTIQFAPPIISEAEEENEAEREKNYSSIYPQNLIGKWKVIKKQPEIITSSENVRKTILEEFNSFLDDYDTYVEFTKNGEYTEYLLDNQIKSTTYKTNGNKIRISKSTDCTYSANSNTLELIFDYTDRYSYDYIDDEPVSQKLGKVELHTYLKRLPDDYDIQAAMKEAMIRDSIIIESKYPEKVKDDIIGKWQPFKTEAIVVSNSKEYNQGLKNMTQDLLSSYNSSTLVFDTDNMIENYDSIPYTIEGNILVTNKENIPFAINDNILTIDRDLRSALIWMGIGIGSHDRMLAIRKYAARTYYVKVTREVYASLRKTHEEFNVFVKNNMQYPPEAIANKKEGRVLVVLRIEADGTISYADVHETIDPLLDAEAIRIARLMTPEWWEPAKENNIVVPSYTAIHIDFKLPE